MAEQDSIKQAWTQATREWVCVACTYLNPEANGTCEKCGLPRQAQATELTQAVTEPLPAVQAGHQPNSDSLSADQEDQDAYSTECPICLEEDAFETHGKYTCEQCKQAVCKACYQNMVDAGKRSCPLCRYEAW